MTVKVDNMQGGTDPTAWLNLISHAMISSDTKSNKFRQIIQYH